MVDLAFICTCTFHTGHSEIVKVLLETKADANAKIPQGECTALYIAAQVSNRWTNKQKQNRDKEKILIRVVCMKIALARSEADEMEDSIATL